MARQRSLPCCRHGLHTTVEGQAALCLFRRSRPPIPSQAVHGFRAKSSGLSGDP